jgi:hypothetical protein
MDEGMAAVLAAGVGLVGALGGALAGGFAAVKGAREGAERAAQGALEQARQQARDQHELWLRQERRVEYAAVLTLMREFHDCLTRVTMLIADPSRQPESLNEAAGQGVELAARLIASLEALLLIGDDAVMTAAEDLDRRLVFSLGKFGEILDGHLLTPVERERWSYVYWDSERTLKAALRREVKGADD